MIRFACAILLTSSLFIVSCIKQDNDPVSCSYDPCALKAATWEIDSIGRYIASHGIDAVKHCSGLYYQIITEGTGLAPTSCSAVSVTYKGTLLNGNVFDKATTAVSFSLVTLIDGWKNGLPLVKKGGKIKLFVPPTLGYGSSPNGNIPGNSILIFDIDVLDVR